MRNRIKPMLWALAVGLGLWGIFFARVADRSVAAHLADVWESPVVQKKAGLIRTAVKDGLQAKLAQLKGGRAAGSEDTAVGELTDADRASLDDLIRRVEASRPRRD